LSPDFPYQYNIGMGVRRRDRALRDSLQAVVDRKAPEIQNILKEYGVPVFPIKQESDADDDKPKAAAPLPPAKDSTPASRP
jgi:hypothetical protein